MPCEFIFTGTLVLQMNLREYWVNPENCLHVWVAPRPLQGEALRPLMVPFTPVGSRDPVISGQDSCLSPLTQMTKLGWRLSSETCNSTSFQHFVVAYIWH